MGYPTTAIRLCALAVAAASCACARPETPPAARAQGQREAREALSRGERYLALDRRRAASRQFFRAVAGFRAAGDPNGESASLHALGRLKRIESRPELALDLFARSRTLATDAALRLEVSLAYGETLSALGRHGAAVEVLERSMREAPPPTRTARSWLQLARAQRALGNLGRARAAAAVGRRLDRRASGRGAARALDRSLLIEVLVEIGELEEAFELSQGLPVSQVQTRLLDAETRLAAYHFGERGSWLWDVSSTRLRVHRLPGAAAVASLVRETHQQLASTDASTPTVARRAAAVLLGPIDLTRVRRLLVASEGPLAALPFGAFPVGGEGEPLVTRAEVVRLPSLPQVSRLLSRPRRSYAKWIAVAADPSYGLKGARREARVIAEMAPPGLIEVAEGSAASKDYVLDAARGDFRVLHLATHAVAGRGLVLGDAILDRGELLRAELSAETVVLSACASGLADVFLERGARRVIASYWSVDDDATAALMRGFYERLFAGAAPAAALREAQMRLREEARFRPARFWAGFELRGDWTS